MTTEQNTDSTSMDLKTAREKSGSTLKELFERTRISVVNLEAIEKGDFHLLPVPIYARNFIKTYADALGVDSKPVLQNYENYLQALQVKEKEQTQEKPSSTPVIVTLGRHKAYLWAACIIIVIAAISFFVSIHNNNPAPETPTQAAMPKEVAVAQLPGQNTMPSDLIPIAIDLPKTENLIPGNQPGGEPKQPQQNAEESQTADAAAPATAPKNIKPKFEEPLGNDEQSVLIINATEETWIRIQTDNKEPFQVLLQPGEKISQKAGRFNLDIGNAGGIRMQFDGKSIENLGKSGQVIHLRLP